MSERVDTTALRDGTYWLERDSIRHALEHAATADGFRHDWYSEDVAPLVATMRKSADEIDALRAKVEDVRMALLDALPPYNFELNPNGSEDPYRSAYVEGIHDVYASVLAALDQPEPESRVEGTTR